MTPRNRAFEVPSHLSGQPKPVEWFEVEGVWLRLSAVTSVRFSNAPPAGPGGLLYVSFVGGDGRTFSGARWPALAAALGIDLEEDA